MIERPDTADTRVVDDPFEVRRAKRESLIASGEQPYASVFHPDAKAKALHDEYRELEDGAETGRIVTVAGRLVAKRDQGKLAFLVLRDGTGEIQLFCRVNLLGEESFATAIGFDVGDWIGATGEVVRTRRGELSVVPTEVKLLSKSLRPLPEKFHGLTDTETRYRQRYADLIANPEVRDVFTTRSRIIASLRRFMESRGYIEVETPMLHPIPGGATARPFVTHHNALDVDLYLRIAPELYLKRLLVGGFERVYEINRSFRNEGMSPRHNPEFTMLESYEAYADVHEIMELTESMIVTIAQEVLGTLEIEYQGQAISLAAPWERRSMSDLVSEKLGRTVSVRDSIEDLRALCDEHGVPYEKSFGTGKLITELFEALVEHTIVDPVFVTDHPLEVSPLARKKDDEPLLTDRFELLIAGREFANAFSELSDPVDQEERFAAQVAAKAAGDDEAMGFDADYIRALEYGMPPAGGLGVGIDRLVMLLTDSASIRDTLLFPAMRPEA